MASTLSHHGVQHVNFGCSCFTGDANTSLHGAASILHDVARRPGDATSIPHSAASILRGIARDSGNVARISGVLLAFQFLPGQVKDGEYLVGGDMIFPTHNMMRGVAQSTAGTRWTNGIVPYVMSTAFTAQQQTLITGAMRNIERLTAISGRKCVQFRPKIATDRYSILIKTGRGCSSHVGQNTGWTGYVFAFDKLTSANSDNQGTPYDYNSIMHYGRKAFSSNGQPTMVPKNPTATIGVKTTLSPIDIQEIQKFYQCK
ncbi:unnamed protein product [Rotaria socialis]|uniref:Metalloendopeptidase n=1 Tax=Rotaria socialis TaxID=392032 RepID=A0A820B2T9_9BILA|nr:unnamed protein product [Rotaria socialis]